MDNKIIKGNALEELKKMQSESVDCIITSPPYYQLRRYSGIPDYVWGGDSNCEHEFGLDTIRHLRGSSANANVGNNKEDYEGLILTKNEGSFCTKCGAWKGQLGNEPTYEMFLDNLISIFKEAKRVLKPTGTLFVNLGDTYSSSGGACSNGGNLGNKKALLQKNGIRAKYNIPDKCLMLIPHRFAIRMVDELGYILRNDIKWIKENGMPESVTDRFSKKSEYIFFFAKEEKYYFDLESIKMAYKQQSVERMSRGLRTEKYMYPTFGQPVHSINKPRGKSQIALETPMKNPGDCTHLWEFDSEDWILPTKNSKAKHYATFNDVLITKPILAGCPEFVCKKCGKPIEKKIISSGTPKDENRKKTEPGNHYKMISGPEMAKYKTENPDLTIEVKCDCNAGYDKGIVLDIFCGSGTTVKRAIDLGRTGIGIDGSDEYIPIAENAISQERLI